MPEKYNTIVEKNYCSCPNWKYQRKPPSQRDCKHLIQQRGYVNNRNTQTYTYTQFKPKFQLISETIPKKPITDTTLYTFSRKFDGIRVMFHKGELVTRNGVKLTGFKYYGSKRFRNIPPLDCELCHISREGHNQVMAALDNNDWSYLKLGVIDTMQETLPFSDRYRIIQQLRLPKDGFFKIQQFAFYKNMTVQQSLPKLISLCQSKNFEGIIVRKWSAFYDSSGKRNNLVIFKVKPSNLYKEHRKYPG